MIVTSPLVGLGNSFKNSSSLLWKGDTIPANSMSLNLGVSLAPVVVPATARLILISWVASKRVSSFVLVDAMVVLLKL